MIDDTVFKSEINVLLKMGEYYSKQIVMESELVTPVPTSVDSVSKWNQFVNWVTRCIKTILAKISKKRLEKQIDDLTSKSLNGKEYRIDASTLRTLNNLIGIGGRMHVNPYGYQYDFKNPSFDKNDGKLYQQRADYLTQHRFKPIERSGTLRTLSADELRKYLDAIKDNSIKIANRLVGIQSHIDETKKQLSDDDRKSEAFQQYVRMLTFELSNDLKIVQFINGFLDAVKLFSKKESDDDNDEELSPDGNIVDNENSSGDDNDNSETNIIKFPPDVSETFKPTGVVKALLDKWVFKKHPNADAIYAYLDDDGDTIQVVYNVSTTGKVKPKSHKFSLKKYKNKQPWKLFMNTENIQKLKHGIKIPKG
jgi:hypothetical protein